MATSASNRTNDTGNSRPPLDPTRVLEDVCLLNSDCRFELVHSAYFIDAIFVGVHPQGVEVRMPPKNGDVDGSRTLLNQTICCVSFAYRSAFCAFLGHIIDVRVLNSGERRVVITLPGTLAVSNLRQSFRVPIVPHSGLQTMVRTPNRRELAVKVLDISETGLEVDFEVNDDLGLSLGIFVDVEMKLQSDVIRKKAEVRRIMGSRCGLMIINSDDIDSHFEKDDHHQVATMHRMVLALQKLWLKSRMN